MDKKVFLLSKEDYSKKQVESMTEEMLEAMVSKPDYDNDSTIIKIDANNFGSADDAISFNLFDKDDYHVIAFGF
jgi:hypothetical protein